MVLRKLMVSRDKKAIVCLSVCVLLGLLGMRGRPVWGALTLLSEEAAQAVLESPCVLNGEDSLPKPCIRLGKGVDKSIAAEDTLDGSAAAFPANLATWCIQWQWDMQQVVPGVASTVYARVRVERNGSDGPLIMQGGVYDNPFRRNVVPMSTVSLAAAADGQWVLVRIGAFTPDQQGQYVWICGDKRVGADTPGRILFDRFVIVPQGNTEHLAALQVARASDHLIHFSLGSVRSAELVFDLAQACDVRVIMAGSLGKGAALVATAAPVTRPTAATPVELNRWTGPETTTEMLCRLARAVPQGGPVRLRLTLSSDGARAVGAVLSPNREELGLRAVWSEPPVGSAGRDVVAIDDATKALSSRRQFDELVTALREQLSPAPFCTRIESSTRKVYRTPSCQAARDDWISAELAQPAKICAARNEYESFQLVLIPLAGRPLHDVVVNCDNWVGPGKLPRLQLNPVGYVNVPKLTYPVGRSGWTPDPLMPPGTLAVRADGMQPVWCTAHIPRDAAAGVYSTVIRVRSRDGHVVAAPVELTVWDFTLMDETHLRSSFWFNRGYLKLFYVIEEDFIPWETIKKWYGFLLDHRITPADCWFARSAKSYTQTYREPDGTISFDFSLQDRLLRYLIEEKHATCFQVGPNCNSADIYSRWPALDRQTQEPIIINSGNRDQAGRATGHFVIDQGYREFVKHYLTSYCAHVQEKGWLELAYHQMFDEPKGEYELLDQLCRLSHDAVPELKVLTTAPWGKLPDGAIEIHVPLMNTYDTESAADVRAQGQETWWYICGAIGHPYPEAWIEYPAEDMRIWPWLSWKYRVQGLLYWGVNEWAGKPYCPNVLHADPAQRWPQGRPWQTNPYRRANGEGYFMYPGPDMQPLASIRLVNLRDGMEDYEYLWTLAQLADRLDARLKENATTLNPDLLELRDRARRILQVSPDVARSCTDYAHHPQAFEAARKEIAAAILQIQSVL